MNSRGEVESTSPRALEEIWTPWPIGLRFKSFQVDVRNLIIDLDADIKADTMMAGREKVEGGPVPPPRPHIPVGGVPTRPMTSMPQSLSRPPHNLNNGQVKPQMGSNFASRPNSTNYGQESNSVDSDKSLKMKIKRTKSGRQEIVKTEGGHNNSHNGNSDNEGSVVKPGNMDSSMSPSSVRTTKPEGFPLHYTTLHYTTLLYTTLHYTTLHYTTLHNSCNCCNCVLCTLYYSCILCTVYCCRGYIQILFC